MTAKLREHQRHGHAKLSEMQVRALHRVYDTTNLSIWEVAGMVWEKAGFSSQTSCWNSLKVSFHRDGLPVRKRNGPHRRKRG